MSEEQIWNKFLEKIQEKLSPILYDTWFKDTYIYKIDANKVIVIVPYQLHKKQLEETYKDLIIEKFNEVTGTNFDFEFLLEEEIKENKKIEMNVGVPFNNPEQANLNPNYTLVQLINLHIQQQLQLQKILVKNIILYLYMEVVV